MKPALIYVLLAVAGTILPLSQFVPWVAVHGLDAGRFLADLFANRIGGFFGMDVIVSAVVVLVLVAREGRGIPGAWVAVPATLLVGVSCGLPLFLALRERARQ